jgi:hypothetical protein
MILPSCWKAQLLIAAAVAFITPISHVDAFSNIRVHTRWENAQQSQLRNRRDLVLFQDSSGENSQLNDDPIKDDETIIASTNEPQINESEIIRILRANPRQCAKPIETASDVLHLMSQSCSPSPSILSVEEIVNNTSPNIAAAALRRLVSTPFIPLTFSTTKKFSQYLYKNQWSNPKNVVGEKEKHLYGRLIHLLVKKLSVVVDEQLQALMEAATNNYDQSSSTPPKLLPKKETWHIPPTPPTNNLVHLNWYAMADLLSSLSVLHNIPHKNKSGRSSSSRNDYLQALINAKEEEDGNNDDIATVTSTSLFHDTIQYLSWDNKVTSSFIRCIGSRRLIRDLLHPLVIAATQQQRMSEDSTRWDDIEFDDTVNDDNHNDVGDEYDISDPNENNLHQLMAVASEYLASPSSLAKVSAADLSIALWSLTQIYQSSQFQPQKLQSYRTFMKACMKRLRKRSVISPARGCEIALAIQSVERLIRLLSRDGDDDDNDESYLQPFQDILSLPLQLPGEEDIIDSDMLTMQTKTYDNGTLPPPTNTQKDGLAADDDMRSDAATMFHTLVNELIFQAGGNAQMKLRSLSLQQVADILQTAIALDVSRDDLQTATTEVLDYLTSDPFVLDQTYSCRDISRTLLSLQRLRVGTGMYNLDLEKSCVQRLGARFLEIVDRQSKGRTRGKCDPKTLTTVLRSGVLMFPRSDVTKSMLDAASLLIRDDAVPIDVSDHDDVIFVDYGVTVPFLEQCNDYELSWILWTFAIARRFDKSVFVGLTDQILENISQDSFTASSASRVMWSASVLLSLDEAGDQHDGRHIDLFHQLSPLLLSSHLSATDLSCAMYAIAKTDYVFGKSYSFPGTEFSFTLQ